MSVENISLFNSVLDEVLERLGKKNLKLKECQYVAVKAVVVLSTGKTGFVSSLLPYWLWKVTYMPASSLRLIEPFISNACAVQATYSFCMSITDYPRASVSFPRDRRLGERDCAHRIK